MTGEASKRMVFSCILKILSTNTNGEEDIDGNKINTMMQKDILDRLKRDYKLERERKALGRDLRELVGFDERIQCTIKTRDGRVLSPEDDTSGAIYTDFWYDHQFDRGELQVVIYNVIFGRHIPARYKKDLVDKLESLNPVAFRHKLKNYVVDDNPGDKKEFYDLFLNMEDLDDAITNRRPVSFRITYYKPDKSIYTSKVEYIVMPLAIVAGKGDFYLLSCPYGLKGVDITGEKQFAIHTNPAEGQDEDILYFIDTLKVKPKKIEDFTFVTRIDRIADLKILERDEVKDSNAMRLAFEKRGGKEDIQKYVASNASLTSGRTIRGSFRLRTRLEGTFSKTLRKGCGIYEVIDYFGKANVRITEEGVEKTPQGKVATYLVRVKTNDDALREFAKTHFESVQLITPDYMRDEIKGILKKAYERMLDAEAEESESEDA